MSDIKDEICTINKIVQFYEEFGPPYLYQYVEISDEEACELTRNTVEALIQFAKILEIMKCSNCVFACKMAEDDFCSKFQESRSTN